MPPPKTKQAKGNPAKKEQLAEKVKEIQLRQKNWMRQRDEHIKSDPDSVNKDTRANKEHYALSEHKNGSRRQSGEHTAQGADILRVHHNHSQAHAQPLAAQGADILRVHHNHSQAHAQPLAAQVSDKLNVKVKHGFGAWLQSRQHTDDTENHAHSNTYDDEGSPGMHNGVSNFQSDASAPSLLSNGASALQSSNRSYPLSPAEFDSLADSIAAKVKKDLGIRHSNGAKLHEETVGERGKTFVQGMYGDQSAHNTGGGDGIDNDDGASNSVDVSSHRCPFCSSLMATPAHVPMLLVPCGHTVCKHCSSSHPSCRLCGTRVGSLTTNIMLQQIIQEFRAGKWKGRGNKGGTREVSSLPATAAPQGADWDRDGRSLPAIPPKTTVSYTSQLHNLQERRATLEEETRSRRRERDHITSKVKRAEKQVKAIEREEDSLEQQIQQLQEKLQGLRQHKGEYAGEYHQLLEDMKSANNQVTLVEQTLKALGEEMDKVQFLAEGQEDGCLQRHSHYR